jgi:RHS repeat-associated protein
VATLCRTLPFFSTTVTITDDDAPPTVAWQGANTNIGEAAGTALVPVVLSAPSAFTVTVVYATSNGSATAGSDYITSSGTLTFAPSQTALNVSIPILNDATAEPNETVTLTLSSPTNATLGTPNPATLTIVDNDGGATGGDEFYQYDTLGDLLQKGATTYTYGATASSCVAGTPAAKPHAAVTAGAATYIYDCDGNMLNGGTRTSMLWDTENRLTSATTSGVPETYGYDADGERITRTSSGVTTVYLVGGLWEETSAGAVKQYYPFNGTVVAVRDSSAGVSYLHGDHLGSVSATSGAQAGGQTFGPWGNVTSGGSSATARNYTGQYLDNASGLLYYHARYYDATLARFISADSVVPGQTATMGTPNPQQLNRYSYVANNPLTTNDPSGHCGEGGVQMSSGGVCEGGPSEGMGGGGGGGGPAEPIAEPIVEPVEAVPPTTQMGPEGGEGVGEARPADTRPPDSPFYEVVYEAKLEPGKDYPGVSAQRHFAEGNRQLHEDMQSDPEFAGRLEAQHPGITEHVSPGPKGAFSREPPPGLTWHHAAEEGVLQLMPRAQHRAAGLIQQILHPAGRGGMEIWGGGR